MKTPAFNVYARWNADLIAIVVDPKERKALEQWAWQASFATEIDANRYVDHYKPHHPWAWRVVRGTVNVADENNHTPETQFDRTMRAKGAR